MDAATSLLRLPLPQQLARGTPRRHKVERTEVPEHKRTRHDEQEERSTTMYRTCRRTEKRWLAEDVDGLDPQYCRPGGPAIANHLTHHEVHYQVSRRRVASDARTRAQNIEEEMTKLVQDPLPLPLPQQPAKMTPQRLPNAQSSCDVRGWPGRAI